MNVRKKHWSEEILDTAEIPVSMLPRLLQAGTFLGLIPERIAREYNLPNGVQLVLGGHDQACSTLACGVIEPGMAMDATGAVECLAPVLAEPVLNNAMLKNHYGCYPHLIPDRYLALAYNFTAGSLLDWYRETFGEAENTMAYDRGLNCFDLLLGKASTGASPVIILPHFAAAGTPTLDQDARGAIVGLTLTTSKAQIVKGMLDGLGYEMRLNIDCLNRAGVQVDRLRVIGGGATSTCWLQLKANIYNRPVEGVDVAEAPARGAALLAGIGSGIYRDVREACRNTGTGNVCFEPQPDEVERYERQYQQYVRLHPALKPITALLR